MAQHFESHHQVRSRKFPLGRRDSYICIEYRRNGGKQIPAKETKKRRPAIHRFAHVLPPMQ